MSGRFVTVEEELHRCELCGVVVAAPPEDTSEDVLCPECTEHLGEVGIEPREVAS